MAMAIAKEDCFVELCDTKITTIPLMSVALSEKFTNFVVLSNQLTYY